MDSLDSNMANTPPSDDLLKVRAQIENATTPFDILGLSHTGPREPKDIKFAYHALALQIHPDKCQHGQEELHTRLFAKLQNAYESLDELQDQIDEDVQFWEREGSTFATAGSKRKKTRTKNFRHRTEETYPDEDAEPEPVLRRPVPTATVNLNDSWGGMEAPEERGTPDQDAGPKHSQGYRGSHKEKLAHHQDMKKAKWARKAEKLDRRVHG